MTCRPTTRSTPTWSLRFLRPVALFTLWCLSFTLSGCATLTAAALGAVVCDTQDCMSDFVAVGATADVVALQVAVEATRVSRTVVYSQPRRPNVYNCSSQSGQYYQVTANNAGEAHQGCLAVDPGPCSCW